MLRFLLLALITFTFMSHHLPAKLNKRRDESPGDGHDDSEFIRNVSCVSQWRPPVILETGVVIPSDRWCRFSRCSMHRCHPRPELVKSMANWFLTLQFAKTPLACWIHAQVGHSVDKFMPPPSENHWRWRPELKPLHLATGNATGGTCWPTPEKLTPRPVNDVGVIAVLPCHDYQTGNQTGNHCKRWDWCTSNTV